MVSEQLKTLIGLRCCSSRSVHWVDPTITDVGTGLLVVTLKRCIAWERLESRWGTARPVRSARRLARTSLLDGFVPGGLWGKPGLTPGLRLALFPGVVPCRFVGMVLVGVTALCGVLLVSRIGAIW